MINRWHQFRICLLQLIMVILFTGCAHSQAIITNEIPCRIVKIIDGDSFKIKPDPGTPHKSLSTLEGLRLIGINSFEMTAKNPHKNMWAHMQKDFAFFFFRNRQATVKLVQTPEGTFQRDIYNRLLGYLYNVNKENYQLRVLKQGIINGFYKYPFNKKLQNQFNNAETHARKNQLGLYQDAPHLIALSECQNHFGQVVSINLEVKRIIRGAQSIFLIPDKRFNFTVVIPHRYVSTFQASKPPLNFKQLPLQWIHVTGLLNILRNKAIIRVYGPSQLKTTTPSKVKPS